MRRAIVGAVCFLGAVNGFQVAPGQLSNAPASSRSATFGCLTAGRLGRGLAAGSKRSHGAQGARMALASDYVPVPKPLLDKVNFPMDIKGMSISELKQLSYELRWEIIEQVSRTGGHLSSSLGVTELTVALHYVFNAPDDKIVWDVAHQCYPHKMLTGRRSRFPSLRQWNGVCVRLCLHARRSFSSACNLAGSSGGRRAHSSRCVVACTCAGAKQTCTRNAVVH
jgi:hypothetical protein